VPCRCLGDLREERIDREVLHERNQQGLPSRVKPGPTVQAPAGPFLLPSRPLRSEAVGDRSARW
jgi:hypothetical protein